MCSIFAPTLDDVAKVSRTRWRARRHRTIETRANALEVGVQAWLDRYARAKLREVNERLESGGIGGLKRSRLAKRLPDDLSDLERELAELIAKFGLAQAEAAGADASRSAGGAWRVRPQLKEQLYQQAANKVVLLVQDTESMVRDSIRRIITDALTEVPRPSPREVGRRIARQWMGPASLRVPARGSLEETRVTADWRRTQREIDAGGREHIFAFSRAQTIARTELGRADNQGIAEGFAVAGVEQVGWLPFANDGRSGKRQHWRMATQSITVEAMQGKDSSKWFRLPNGERAPYPHYLGLSAFNVVNCRCTLVPK